MSVSADFTFSENRVTEIFTCNGCTPLIGLDFRQCHIIINALSNIIFDRALMDEEAAELALTLSIVIKAMVENS